MADPRHGPHLGVPPALAQRQNPIQTMFLPLRWLSNLDFGEFNNGKVEPNCDLPRRLQRRVVVLQRPLVDGHCGDDEGGKQSEPFRKVETCHENVLASEPRNQRRGRVARRAVSAPCPSHRALACHSLCRPSAPASEVLTQNPRRVFGLTPPRFHSQRTESNDGGDGLGRGIPRRNRRRTPSHQDTCNESRIGCHSIGVNDVQGIVSVTWSDLTGWFVQKEETCSQTYLNLTNITLSPVLCRSSAVLNRESGSFLSEEEIVSDQADRLQWRGNGDDGATDGSHIIPFKACTYATIPLHRSMRSSRPAAAST